MFRQRRVQGNKKYHAETEGLWWENDQNCHIKYRVTDHQTKENGLNQIEEIENN